MATIKHILFPFDFSKQGIASGSLCPRGRTALRGASHAYRCGSTRVGRSHCGNASHDRAWTRKKWSATSKSRLDAALTKEFAGLAVRRATSFRRSGAENYGVRAQQRRGPDHDADARMRAVPQPADRLRYSQGPARCEVSRVDRYSCGGAAIAKCPENDSVRCRWNSQRHLGSCNGPSSLVNRWEQVLSCSTWFPGSATGLHCR